jgi:hypothetical protein
MREAIPALPQYVFMAWCSAKRGTGANLPLPLRETKWWDSGEDCMSKSFMTSTLSQTLFGR